jgi:glycosyltransferase involved in cell wall biosynthesis
MDMNPDQMVALGKATSCSPLVLALKWLNAKTFARAAEVVVLDRYMRARVERQYRVGGRMTVLPPWSRQDGVTEVAMVDNPFRAQHGQDGRFVAMYSGNHSPASPIRTFLSAALALQSDPRFLFMFVGGGLSKSEVDEAIGTYRPTNVLSLPYQPSEYVKYSLSAADVHVVTLGNDMVCIIHPSKIYGAMGVGRPVLFIGPRPSYASEVIEQHRIGWQVEHGDVSGAVEKLRCIASLPASELAAMGERARTAIRDEFGKDRLCTAFCDVVEESMRLAPSTVAMPADVS